MTAPQAIKRDRWNSMDTAPRDGTCFLAVNMSGIGVHRLFICYSSPEIEGGQSWADNAGWMEPGHEWPSYPTHWMPLPELPTMFDFETDASGEPLNPAE